jgi:hypothetical protein
MIKKLCEYLKTFDCSESGINYREKIESLEKEIIKHINQIQELKAVNHYQTFDLENKIAALIAENTLLKDNSNQKDETC